MQLQLIDHLILPVIMWSPVEQYPNLTHVCPKCSEDTFCESSQSLTPIAWTSGCNPKFSPRLIHDVNCNVLLLSRVYKCNNGHEIYGHHRYFVEHEETKSRVPFLLWHSTGFTVSFIDHLEQLICSGMSLQECERNLYKNRMVMFF